MKILKFGLRFWITLTSAVTFVTGWIMLAHAPKPDQQSSLFSSISSSSVPTLEPLPPLSDFNANGNDLQSQSWFSLQPSPRTFRPMFRTGGS